MRQLKKAGANKVAEREYRHDGDGRAEIEIKALSFITAANGQRSVVIEVNGEVIVLHEWTKKTKKIKVDAHVQAFGTIEVLPKYA